MDYKINYKKLENLKQTNYIIFIAIFVLILILLLIIGYFKSMNEIETFYGIYSDDVLTFKINSKLSDKLKSQNKFSFNNKNVNYKIINFSDYEILNNEIYVTVNMELDGDFYQNEVGEIKLVFDKKKIIFYIFDLFKWGGISMNVLSNEEMLNIKGGAIKYRIIGAAVGGLIVFIIGLVNGLVNPQKCN